MKTLFLILLIVIIVVALTKYVMKHKNETIIKSMLNISDYEVDDFECEYGKNKHKTFYRYESRICT